MKLIRCDQCDRMAEIPRGASVFGVLRGWRIDDPFLDQDPHLDICPACLRHLAEELEVFDFANA